MKYKVEGYALCPVKVSVEVEADSESEALRLASKIAHDDRGRYVVANSEAPNNWEDWQPFVEPMPNTEMSRERSSSG